MRFWSRGRAQKPGPKANSPSSCPADTDLSVELEPASAQPDLAAYGGRASVPAKPSTSQTSGLHSRLTLQRSRTIYHVGGREIPTHASITPSALDHLHDLCMRLLGNEEQARVILVVSEPAARAAKSLVAAQLASLLSADYGPNVLALEADLGAPALHKALGFLAPRGYGLDEQLKQLMGMQSGLVSIVQLNQRLAALVASEPTAMTPQAQACFQAVLTQLRREHEFIVMDGPALGSEAALDHLQQADGVLFVACEGSKLTHALASVGEHLPNRPLIRIVEIADLSPARSSWRAGRHKR